LKPIVGSRFPAHESPLRTGPSCVPREYRAVCNSYFQTAKLEALTERTVTDPHKLRALIEDCRR